MDTEQEIKKIQERNAQVELSKAWETSRTRTITICSITYIVVLVFNAFVNIGTNIFITSAIPMIGFFLSTLSLPLVRKIWEKIRDTHQ